VGILKKSISKLKKEFLMSFLNDTVIVTNQLPNKVNYYTFINNSDIFP